MPESERMRLRQAIVRKVRDLRQQRRWTQSELAERLGLSQNRLSEVEHGKGSFTAEQFLLIVKLFNVSFDDFLPRKKGPPAAQIQNALARLGAVHLHESEEAFPTDRLNEAVELIYQVLIAPETARHVAALAPIIINHAPHLSLRKLRGRLAEAGAAHRLGWLLDNVRHALVQELRAELSPRIRIKYQRAENLLSIPVMNTPGMANKPADILDPDIASSRSTEDVKKARSSLSRKWGVITRMQISDFVSALRQARGAD